jgi:indolepyruvate ferredoxin oxidoreductase beta subunit
MNLPDPFNVIVSGVGGQGNILIARLIGRILAQRGYQVSIGETFGAAQRGGSVFSSLRISRKRAYSPLIPAGCGHVIIGLEPMETLRMLSRFGNAQVTALSNDRPIYPVDVLGGRDTYPDEGRICAAIAKAAKHSYIISATRIASELGSVLMTNVVMLGALVETGALPLEAADTVEEVARTVPAAKKEENLEAFSRGAQAIREPAEPVGRKG